MNTANENQSQYGPYSPQELDRASKWLQAQGTQFEIIRNDQEARESLMNDGQNLVNLADLRTGIYLAQIFYISLPTATDLQRQEFEMKFTLKAESFPHRKQSEIQNDEAVLHSSSLKNKFKKRGWAALLAVVIVVQILIVLYNIVSKES
ncbi:MAG: hypothetical protein H7328_13030 [Bdellovibrio sp.]|nr:hypothetical protein [Bdellovibrio sp.]